MPCIFIILGYEEIGERVIPTYCFRVIKTNEPREVFLSYSEYDTRITSGGVFLDRDFTALMRDKAPEWARVATRLPSCWPMVSDSMGVGEGQQREAEEHSIKEGVPTHFNDIGQAVFDSPSHLKKYAERYEFYSKNGGYNDPQRR